MSSETPFPSNQPNQPNPAGGQARQLNLQQMAGQFMAAVQRQLDLLAYNLTGQASSTEEAYRARAEQPELRRLVGPLGNYEQLQAFARDLLARQTLGDATNLAVQALHNTHLFLALVKGSGGSESGSLPREVQQQAQKAQEDFVRAPLDQKFNLLEEHYGVLCPLEDTIVGYGQAMHALIQQGGVVRAAQLKDGEPLTLELQSAPTGSFEDRDPWFDKLQTRSKQFREGDQITFSDKELQLAVFTVAVFAHQLFSSITRYAREIKQGA